MYITHILNALSRLCMRNAVIQVQLGCMVTVSSIPVPLALRGQHIRFESRKELANKRKFYSLHARLLCRVTMSH
jgi:hypothetical protein